MAATPTNGHSCFPFAVQCRLTKTFFGVPRKCSVCGKMIMLTAGMACQFCRYRCHRRCTGEGPHQCSRPKLCSLSRLPSTDGDTFRKLLLESEINCNEVDVFPENWTHLSTSSSWHQPSSNTVTPKAARPLVPRKYSSDWIRPSDDEPSTSSRGSRSYSNLQPTDSIDSVETITTTEPTSPLDVEDPILDHGHEDPLGMVSESGEESEAKCVEEQQETVMDRFLRLIPWSRSWREKNQSSEESTKPPGLLNLPRPSSGSCSGGCPSSPMVVTPVDEFNYSVLEELFAKRSTSSSSSTCGPLGTSNVLSRRLNWVRFMAGKRAAQSQDCMTERSLFSPDDSHKRFEFSKTLLGPDQDFPEIPGVVLHGLGDSDNSLPSDPPDRLSASWPLLGLHMNHDEEISESEMETSCSTNGDSGYESLPTTSRPPALFSRNKRPSISDFGEWEIEYGSLECERSVVEGRFAETFQGKWHGEVMIHRFRHEVGDSLDSFLSFVYTLTKIRHENIALFMGACLHPPNVAIITSQRKGDSLFEAIYLKERTLSHHFKVNIAKQTAQGLGYLHAKKIILKCLSSKNLFLESKVKICMVEHGGPLVKYKTQENEAAVYRGQLTYLAPELMSSLRVEPPYVNLSSTHTQNTDIYAFGTVLYEMFAGDYPLAGLAPETIIWLIGSGQRQGVDGLSCHVAMKSLIEDCWSPDPGYRPTLTEILKDLNQTDMRARSVKLTLVGAAFVTWVPNAGETAERPFSKEDYIRESRSLWVLEEESLKRGKHTFPFEFIIPENAPPSLDVNPVVNCESLWRAFKGLGSITFILIAEIIRGSSPSRRDPRVKREIKILPDIPLEKYPVLKAPIVVAKEKPFKGFCKRTHGRIFAVAAIKRRGFVRGEQVEVAVHVCNETEGKIKIKRLNFQLVSQVVLYNAGGAKRYQTIFLGNQLIREFRGGVRELKGHEDVVPLDMPPDMFLPTMSKDRCYIIQVEHIIRIVVEFCGVHRALLIEVPLVLGTSPFFS